ncbi:uncharacterized protein J5M81_008684 [Pluvialis apricaria]
MKKGCYTSEIGFSVDSLFAHKAKRGKKKTFLFHTHTDDWQMENLFQLNLEHGHCLGEKKEKKKELQRNFEEPCAPEELPALPFSSIQDLSQLPACSSATV